MDRLRICNAKIITPFRIIDRGHVLISGGKIEKVGTGEQDSHDCCTIDARGNYLAPGFIDMHTHGGGGHDFMDATPEAFIGAAEMHAKHGTTSLVPTTLAGSMDELRKALEAFREAKRSAYNGAGLLGMHLEGPYFSYEQRGAQDPRYIRNPDRKEYLEILSWSDDIIRWSAAPELEGALEFGRELKKRGILVSVAHSDAVCEQVLEAIENGYTHITHLYSSMSGVRRINAFRYAGVIESAFLSDDLTVEIIADGRHLPQALLKLIYKIKGPCKTALITDSMRGAGMPEGETMIGSLKNGQRAIIEDGVAKLPDRTAFAGSVATADRLVRTMRDMAEVPLTDAVRMITATPAAIMGVDINKGSIAAGKDADLVVFDDKIDILLTVVNGKPVYKNMGGKENG